MSAPAGVYQNGASGYGLSYLYPSGRTVKLSLSGLMSLQSVLNGPAVTEFDTAGIGTASATGPGFSISADLVPSGPPGAYAGTVGKTFLSVDAGGTTGAGQSSDFAAGGAMVSDSVAWSAEVTIAEYVTRGYGTGPYTSTPNNSICAATRAIRACIVAVSVSASSGAGAAASAEASFALGALPVDLCQMQLSAGVNGPTPWFPNASAWEAGGEAVSVTNTSSFTPDPNFPMSGLNGIEGSYGGIGGAPGSEFGGGTPYIAWVNSFDIAAYTFSMTTRSSAGSWTSAPAAPSGLTDSGPPQPYWLRSGSLYSLSAVRKLTDATSLEPTAQQMATIESVMAPYQATGSYYLRAPLSGSSGPFDAQGNPYSGLLVTSTQVELAPATSLIPGVGFFGGGPAGVFWDVIATEPSGATKPNPNTLQNAISRYKLKFGRTLPDDVLGTATLQRVRTAETAVQVNLSVTGNTLSKVPGGTAPAYNLAAGASWSAYRYLKLTGSFVGSAYLAIGYKAPQGYTLTVLYLLPAPSADGSVTVDLATGGLSSTQFSSSGQEANANESPTTPLFGRGPDAVMFLALYGASSDAAVEIESYQLVAQYGDEARVADGFEFQWNDFRQPKGLPANDYGPWIDNSANYSYSITGYRHLSLLTDGKPVRNTTALAVALRTWQGEGATSPETNTETIQQAIVDIGQVYSQYQGAAKWTWNTDILTADPLTAAFQVDLLGLDDEERFVTGPYAPNLSGAGKTWNISPWCLSLAIGGGHYFDNTAIVEWIEGTVLQGLLFTEGDKTDGGLASAASITAAQGVSIKLVSSELTYYPPNDSLSFPIDQGAQVPPDAITPSVLTTDATGFYRVGAYGNPGTLAGNGFSGKVTVGPGNFSILDYSILASFFFGGVVRYSAARSALWCLHTLGANRLEARLIEAYDGKYTEQFARELAIAGVGPSLILDNSGGKALLLYTRPSDNAVVQNETTDQFNTLLGETVVFSVGQGETDFAQDVSTGAMIYVDAIPQSTLDTENGIDPSDDPNAALMVILVRRKDGSGNSLAFQPQAGCYLSTIYEQILFPYTPDYGKPTVLYLPPHKVLLYYGDNFYQSTDDGSTWTDQNGNAVPSLTTLTAGPWPGGNP